MLATPVQKTTVRIDSILVLKVEFSPKTGWVTSWDEFNKGNKFLVTQLTNAECGMSLNCQEWTLQYHFCTGVRRRKMYYCSSKIKDLCPKCHVVLELMFKL